MATTELLHGLREEVVALLTKRIWDEHDLQSKALEHLLQTADVEYIRTGIKALALTAAQTCLQINISDINCRFRKTKAAELAKKTLLKLPEKWQNVLCFCKRDQLGFIFDAEAAPLLDKIQLLKPRLEEAVALSIPNASFNTHQEDVAKAWANRDRLAQQKEFRFLNELAESTQEAASLQVLQAHCLHLFSAYRAVVQLARAEGYGEENGVSGISKVCDTWTLSVDSGFSAVISKRIYVAICGLEKSGKSTAICQAVEDVLPARATAMTFIAIILLHNSECECPFLHIPRSAEMRKEIIELQKYFAAYPEVLQKIQNKETYKDESTIQVFELLKSKKCLEHIDNVADFYVAESQLYSVLRILNDRGIVIDENKDIVPVKQWELSSLMNLFPAIRTCITTILACFDRRAPATQELPALYEAINGSKVEGGADFLESVVNCVSYWDKALGSPDVTNPPPPTESVLDEVRKLCLRYIISQKPTTKKDEPAPKKKATPAKPRNEKESSTPSCSVTAESEALLQFEESTSEGSEDNPTETADEESTEETAERPSFTKTENKKYKIQLVADENIRTKIKVVLQYLSDVVRIQYEANAYGRPYFYPDTPLDQYPTVECCFKSLKGSSKAAPGQLALIDTAGFRAKADGINALTKCVVDKCGAVLMLFELRTALNSEKLKEAISAVSFLEKKMWAIVYAVISKWDELNSALHDVKKEVFEKAGQSKTKQSRAQIMEAMLKENVSENLGRIGTERRVKPEQVMHCSAESQRIVNEARDYLALQLKTTPEFPLNAAADAEEFAHIHADMEPIYSVIEGGYWNQRMYESTTEKHREAINRTEANKSNISKVIEVVIMGSFQNAGSRSLLAALTTVILSAEDLNKHNRKYINETKKKADELIHELDSNQKSSKQVADAVKGLEENIAIFQDKWVAGAAEKTWAAALHSVDRIIQDGLWKVVGDALKLDSFNQEVEQKKAVKETEADESSKLLDPDQIVIDIPAYENYAGTKPPNWVEDGKGKVYFLNAERASKFLNERPDDMLDMIAQEFAESIRNLFDEVFKKLLTLKRLVLNLTQSTLESAGVATEVVLLIRELEADQLFAQPSEEPEVVIEPSRAVAITGTPATLNVPTIPKVTITAQEIEAELKETDAERLTKAINACKEKILRLLKSNKKAVFPEDEVLGRHLWGNRPWWKFWKWRLDRHILKLGVIRDLTRSFVVECIQTYFQTTLQAKLVSGAAEIVTKTRRLLSVLKGEQEVKMKILDRFEKDDKDSLPSAAMYQRIGDYTTEILALLNKLRDEVKSLRGAQPLDLNLPAPVTDAFEIRVEESIYRFSGDNELHAAMGEIISAVKEQRSAEAALNAFKVALRGARGYDRPLLEELQCLVYYWDVNRQPELVPQVVKALNQRYLHPLGVCGSIARPACLLPKTDKIENLMGCIAAALNAGDDPWCYYKELVELTKKEGRPATDAVDYLKHKLLNWAFRKYTEPASEFSRGIQHMFFKRDVNENVFSRPSTSSQRSPV